MSVIVSYKDRHPIVEEWKNNFMSLVILFQLLCAQNISDINTLVFCGVRVLQPATRTPPNISRSKNCNTQRTKNKTTDVVIHQQSRRLLKMDILMSDICWAHNNWNKITSDIKLVFHSSIIAMMHGPINIRFTLRISYCFSTATVVTRTRLNVTFIRTLPVLFKA